MAEVLVTVLFVTVFTSLLFSSGARRYRSALNFAAGTEARLAAEAVVQILVENMCQEEPTGILENYRDRRDFPETEAAVGRDWKWGEKRDRDSHLLPLERGTVQDLCYRRSVPVNDRKEGASRLIPMAPVFVEYAVFGGTERGGKAMKRDGNGMRNGSTLVELMTAFLILLLVAEAMLPQCLRLFKDRETVSGRFMRQETDWNAIWEMRNTGNRQRSIWRLMEKNFWNRDISRKKRRIPEPSRSQDSGCP